MRSGLILISGLVFFSCETDSGELGIEIPSNVEVDFQEFTLKTTNLVIDSLRTDAENLVIVGNHADDMLGSVSTAAYLQVRYNTGQLSLDTLKFDSLVLRMKIDQILRNSTALMDSFLIFPLEEELHRDVVYLADFEVEKAIDPVDTMNVFTRDENVGLKNFQNGLGRYLLDEILSEDSITTSFQRSIAIVPFENTSTLMSFDMSTDSASFSIYTSDSEDNSFETKFSFTGTHFTGISRDRRINAAEVNDLDTLEVSTDFTVINPLFGVHTLVDLAPLQEFVRSNENLIINRAEIESMIDPTTDTPQDGIRYYFYEPSVGIKGDGIFLDPVNAVILSNEGYLGSQNRILVGRADSANYNSDITLFTEVFLNRYIDEQEFMTDRLVITGNRFVNLSETRIKSDQINLRIYYTFLK